MSTPDDPGQQSRDANQQPPDPRAGRPAEQQSDQQQPGQWGSGRQGSDQQGSDQQGSGQWGSNPPYQPPPGGPVRYEPAHYEQVHYEPVQYEQPTYGQPAYGQPTYDPPTYDPPNYDPSQFGQAPYRAAPDPYGPPPAQDAQQPLSLDKQPQHPGGQQQPYEQQQSYGQPPQSYQQAPYEQTGYQQTPYQPTGYQQAPYQPQGYGQAGHGPAGYAPARTPNRTPIFIGLGAAIVVALAVIGIVIFTGGDDGKNNNAQTPPPTGSSSPTSGAPTTGGPPTTGAPTTAPATSGPLPPGATPTTVPQITVPPVISGWQGVLSYKEQVAYDVPPGWKVETPGTLVGFEDKKGNVLAIMHGVTTYKPNACPSVSGSYRGEAGFKTAGDLDPTTAAQSGVKQFAEGAAVNDDGTTSPVTTTAPVSIKVDQGRIAATMATATLTPEPGQCEAPKVLFTAVAFKVPSGTALFIMYQDQGVADALPAATAQQVITSLRPYSA